MNDKLTESDLCNLIDQAVFNSVNEQGNFRALNRKLFDYYMGEPFGNEVKDQSQVVSTDCADVVESDMPSLARIFLGAGEVVEFQPTSDKPEDVAEAEEKNIYINYILRNVEGSFKKQIDFLKATEIQKVGVRSSTELKKPRLLTTRPIRVSQRMRWPQRLSRCESALGLKLRY